MITAILAGQLETHDKVSGGSVAILCEFRILSSVPRVIEAHKDLDHVGERARIVAWRLSITAEWHHTRLLQLECMAELSK